MCGRGLNIIGTPAPNTRLRLLELSRSLILSLHVVFTLSSLSLSSLLSSCKRDMQMGPIVVNLLRLRPPPISISLRPLIYAISLSHSPPVLTFLCFNPLVQFFKTSLIPFFFFFKPLWLSSYTPYYTNTPIREVVVPTPPFFPTLEQYLTSFTFA